MKITKCQQGCGTTRILTHQCFSKYRWKTQRPFCFLNLQCVAEQNMAPLRMTGAELPPPESHHTSLCTERHGCWPCSCMPQHHHIATTVSQCSLPISELTSLQTGSKQLTAHSLRGTAVPRWWRCTLAQPLQQCLLKLNRPIPYDPAISFARYNLLLQEKYTRMFTAGLFIKTPSQK